jgi:MarR family transcriptional regulator, organic hydroperoxide resistance regulator
METLSKEQLSLAGQEEIIEQTMRLYGRTLALVDPSRLEAWVGLGLTMTQLGVLFLLRQEAGEPAGLLAERLRVTPSTLTRIVDRLVRLNLVRRQEDSDDRRLVRHYLTPEGAQSLEEMARTARAYLTEILRQLPREKLERLFNALQDLTQAAEAVEKGAAASQGEPGR